MISPLAPMLATSAQPFDSFEYLFEVKWNGVRALAAVEDNHWRLWGRELADYNDRYPELDLLRRLPSGTVVDGELVVMPEGQPPDFGAMLRRHQLTSPVKIRQACRQTPVRYVLFDLLYHQGKSVIREPLYSRRQMLVDLLPTWVEPTLVFSEGVAGLGEDLFTRVVAQGHEGVMAKHQASRYLPGKRSSAWRKIKPWKELPCLILGYTPSRRGGFYSLLVAAKHQGKLRYVGQVKHGYSGSSKTDLLRRMAQRRRPQAVVVCPHQALWVEPEYFCRVRFLDWSSEGYLRAASFQGLLEGAI